MLSAHHLVIKITRGHETKRINIIATVTGNIAETMNARIGSISDTKLPGRVEPMLKNYSLGHESLETE